MNQALNRFRAPSQGLVVYFFVAEAGAGGVADSSGIARRPVSDQGEVIDESSLRLAATSSSVIPLAVFPQSLRI